ncbi:transposase [Streptomyces sp. NPDC002935]|uniref:transposase n=1 Tax=Streptomyces sp. NPDC002935 TaxID=3154545 RepID=UPI0033B9DF5E
MPPGAACAPVLAVGDTAFGFWKALAEAFPDTRHQRRRVHRTANVVNALPMSAQAGERKALQKIYNAAGTRPVASSPGNPAGGCRPVRFNVRRSSAKQESPGTSSAEENSGGRMNSSSPTAVPRVLLRHVLGCQCSCTSTIGDSPKSDPLQRRSAAAGPKLGSHRNLLPPGRARRLCRGRHGAVPFHYLCGWGSGTWSSPSSTEWEIGPVRLRRIRTMA